MRTQALGMTMVDLCDLWSTLKGKDGLELLTNISIDKRIDVNLLMKNMLGELGGMIPKWTNTTQFEWGHRLWFETHYENISDMLDTLEYEYNPIENYILEENDVEHTVRDNKYVDTFGEGYKNTIVDKQDETNTHDMTHGHNGTDTEDVNYGRTDDNEHKVSAFNESVYQPQSQDSGKLGGTDTTTDTYNSSTNDNGTIKHEADNTKTEDHQRSGDNTHKTDDDENFTRNHKAHGNTAMYTTQDLIKQQREIIQFNIITWIINWYKNDNILLIF